MDRRSKTLIIIFSFVVTVSIVATFYRYVVVEDIEYFVDEEAFQQSLLEE